MPDLLEMERNIVEQKAYITTMLLPDSHEPNGFEVVGKSFEKEGFLNFLRTNNPLGYIRPPESTGWKFHISVDQQDRQKAFDIIYDEAKKADLHSFKVTTESLTEKWQDSYNGQRGKIFTVYDKGEPEFKSFLTAIEQRMREADIKPSHEVIGDRGISGSQYLYYRNDATVNSQEYRSADSLKHLSEAERYNPEQLPDPFKNFTISERAPAKYNNAVSNLAEKPAVKAIAPELTRTEWHIGRLPWVDVNSRGSSVARVDAALLSKHASYVDNLLVSNGVISEMITSASDGRQYLQVADAESLKRLDELRIKSTSWIQTLPAGSEKSASYTALPSVLQKEPSLSFAREQFNVREMYANEQGVLRHLAGAYRRQGLNVSTELSDGQWRLSLPENQVGKLSALLGTSLDNFNDASTEVKSSLMQNSVIDNIKSAYAEPKYPAMKAAAIGAGFGVVTAGPAIYETYQDASEQVKQGNPVGAGTTVLNSAAELVAGGVCGAGAAVVALPVLAVPVAGEIAYGGAVLGAGYACSEATKNFLETSQHFTNQVRQNALNNGLDPDKAVEQLQNVSIQIPNQSLAVNQDQAYTR